MIKYERGTWQISKKDVVEFVRCLEQCSKNSMNLSRKMAKRFALENI